MTLNQNHTAGTAASAVTIRELQAELAEKSSNLVIYQGSGQKYFIRHVIFYDVYKPYIYYYSTVITA